MIVIQGRWPQREPVRAYAEASYFDGYHFQHIADYLDHCRLQMIERDVEAYRRRHPRIAELWT